MYISIPDASLNSREIKGVIDPNRANLLYC